MKENGEAYYNSLIEVRKKIKKINFIVTKNKSKSKKKSEEI